jgi:hypothetical protein
LQAVSIRCAGALSRIEKSASVFRKYVIVWPRLAAARGTDRDRHGRWQRDAMDVLARRDEAH